MTFWVVSKDGDKNGYILYRRHYSAKKNKHPKVRLFVGPGEKLVLMGFMCNAVFAWRKFIDDSGQQGINCAVFRNESSHRSSDMIREAMQLAFDLWGWQRLYTMVNADETKRRRSKRHPPGWCFIQAGWRWCGKTAKGLDILEFINNEEQHGQQSNS